MPVEALGWSLASGRDGLSGQPHTFRGYLIRPQISYVHRTHSQASSGRLGADEQDQQLVGKADISPLILTANLSGTLLFAYDCKVTADSGWTWMQLEVWVDDQKVWNVAREQGYVSSLADYVTIALPARHGRIEWRVNSGAHVLANAPSHLVHCGEMTIPITARSTRSIAKPMPRTASCCAGSPWERLSLRW